MRFKVGIEFDESLELPFNYNKILQGLYTEISWIKTWHDLYMTEDFLMKNVSIKCLHFQGYKVNFN